MRYDRLILNCFASFFVFKVLKEASCSAAVTVIALDSADESVLVGHSDGSIRLWDLVAPSDRAPLIFSLPH